MIKIVEVEPIGTRRVAGFWDGHDEAGNHRGGFGEFDRNVYPSSPNGVRFREVRKLLELSLFEVARRFEVSAAAVSGLERGSHAPENGDWEALLDELEKLAFPKEEPHAR